MPFHTCGPNEAMVVSGINVFIYQIHLYVKYYFIYSKPTCTLYVEGCCLSKPQLIPGGRVFVWSGFQKLQRYVHLF